MRHLPILRSLLTLLPLCLALACYTDPFDPGSADDDDTLFDDDDGADDDDAAPDDDDSAPDDDDGADDDEDDDADHHHAADDDDATLPTGPPVPDPTALVGLVYSLDLGSAIFTEPPGAGAIIQKNLADQYLLFSLTDDSDFEDGAQPGLHVVGGAGELVGGGVQQDLCEETINMTAGADREFGTADDTPALWVNPALSLGPTELVIDVDGTDSTIQDLLIQGIFTPAMDAFTEGTLSGLLDTRSLDSTLGGEEGAVCSFVEEVYSVICQECGSPAPGEFCLTVVAENVTGAYLPGTVLEPRSCDQIIWNWISVGECQGEAEAYDADGAGNLDGDYQECPEFSF